MAQQDAKTLPSHLGGCVAPVPASPRHGCTQPAATSCHHRSKSHRRLLRETGSSLGSIAGRAAPARLARPHLISPQKRCIFIALHLYFHVPSLQLC